MMTAKNIAIVLAPNVLRPQVETLEKIRSDTSHCIGCVQYSLLKLRHSRGIVVASDMHSSSLYARVWGTPVPRQRAATTTANESVLPPNWQKVTDPSSGRVYYANAVTKESSWVHPGAAAPAPAPAPLTSLPNFSSPPPPTLLSSVSSPNMRLGLGPPSSPPPATLPPVSSLPPPSPTPVASLGPPPPSSLSSLAAEDSSDEEGAETMLQDMRKAREALEKLDQPESKTGKTSEAALDAFEHKAIDEDAFGGEDTEANTRTSVCRTSCTTALPLWERLFHAQSNRYYYCSVANGQTLWTLDPEVDTTLVATRSRSTENPKWHMLQIEGQWDSKSAGGCFPNFASWRRNPQFRISLKAAGSAEIIVQLQWLFDGPPPAPPPGKSRPRHPAIGLYVVRNDGDCQELTQIAPETTITRSPFKTSGDVQSSPFQIGYHEPSLGKFITMSETDRADMDFPVHYTIIPSTFEPDQLGRFRLLVHSSADFHLLRLSEREKWIHRSVHSEWKGDSAGGCRNNAQSWAKNPKFSVNSSTPQLMTIVVRQNGDPSSPHAIGFYCIDNEGTVTKPFGFASSLEVTSQIEFNPAQAPYLLVPCTFDSGCECPFTLMVFGPAEFSLAKDGF